VSRWINGRDPRQYGLDFGRHHLCLGRDLGNQPRPPNEVTGRDGTVPPQISPIVPAMPTSENHRCRFQVRATFAFRHSGLNLSTPRASLHKSIRRELGGSPMLTEPGLTIPYAKRMFFRNMRGWLRDSGCG
jgi:hypothetical protein